MTERDVSVFPCRVRVVEDRLWIARLAETIARAAGLSSREALDVALVASELASNVARHGGGGTIAIEAVSSPRSGVRVRTVNPSRGASEPACARNGGLGAGLQTVQRLVDVIDIADDGAETRVDVTRYRGRL
jgi:anti-sigma regulatory factor (Ser/Thr protein kinase)